MADVQNSADKQKYDYYVQYFAENNLIDARAIAEAIRA
jgi:hypothetical protein